MLPKFVESQKPGQKTKTVVVTNVLTLLKKDGKTLFPLVTYYTRHSDYTVTGQ